MERLADLTERMKQSAARHTAGHWLQIMAKAKNEPRSALALLEASSLPWLDRAQIAAALKAVVSPLATGDYPTAWYPVADSFLSWVRTTSVPRRMIGLRNVPMLTRVFINGAGMIAAEVTEGNAYPVLKGKWSTSTLTPRRFGGITVQTDELMNSTSPTASAAIADDLAQACADAENKAFTDPTVVGSVLNGAPHFTGTGSTVAQVDADLKRLIDLVPGVWRGGYWVMSKDTATAFSLVRGSGGDAAYEDITPMGGKLLGFEVLITSAMADEGSPPSRLVGLLDPAEIFWAADPGGVRLNTSKNANLQMVEAPSAGPASTVSMFEADSIALLGEIQSSWLAPRAGGAYYVAAF